MPRKASALHALADPGEAAREASPGRPRPRATVDDSDGEVGKWGVQRRGAGDELCQCPIAACAARNNNSVTKILLCGRPCDIIVERFL